MRFHQVLIDPAWAYNNRLTGKGRTKFGSGASGKYHTEQTDAMAAFPVPDVLDDECLVHIWVTGPFVFDAKALMEAWGLQFVTLEFLWIKTRKPPKRSEMMQDLYSKGLIGFMQSYTRRMPGHYTASNMEAVFLAVKEGTIPDELQEWIRWMPEIVLLGRKKSILPIERQMWPQLIYAPPPQGIHSRKPLNVHRYIEECYPGERCLELFARPELWTDSPEYQEYIAQPRKYPACAWYYLGDEIDGRDLRESLPELAAREPPVLV